MVILHSKAIRKNQHILYLKVPFDVFVLIILYWMGVTSISFKTVNIPHVKWYDILHCASRVMVVGNACHLARGP